MIEPFRATTMAFIDRVESGPTEAIVAVPRLVMGSNALRERLFLGWEQEVAALTPVIAPRLVSRRTRSPRAP